MAGKQAKCQSCQAIMQVPASNAAAGAGALGGGLDSLFDEVTENDVARWQSGPQKKDEKSDSQNSSDAAEEYLKTAAPTDAHGKLALQMGKQDQPRGPGGGAIATHILVAIFLIPMTSLLCGCFGCIFFFYFAYSNHRRGFDTLAMIYLIGGIFQLLFGGLSVFLIFIPLLGAGAG